jgi:solute carrier family 9B (sodium/hydrogen exchanger), member 1/2
MIQSILIVLLLGLLADRLFRVLGLPGLLGMILVGVAVGPYGAGLLDPLLLAASADVRMLALVVILLRAGLGLEKDVLQKVGPQAIKMSAIPCLLEGFAAMLAAHTLLGLPLIEAGMLGFILAAVSPAVVVPAMLSLKERGLGMDKGVPVIVLAGASVDDVFAITLFTAFVGLSSEAGESLLLQIARIPVQIAGGVLLGIAGGWLLYRLFRQKSVRLRGMERLALLVAAALAILVIGQRLELAGLLGVMTLGFVLLERANGIAADLQRALDRIWFVAQILLFVLIGAEVNMSVALQAGLVGLGVVLIGLVGRATGVLIALHGSKLNAKERAFCALAYLPKATVQAAIGGIPLAMGLASGEMILAIAVLAVVLTASLGAVGIHALAPRLLQGPATGSVD